MRTTGSQASFSFTSSDNLLSKASGGLYVYSPEEKSIPESDTKLVSTESEKQGLQESSYTYTPEIRKKQPKAESKSQSQDDSASE